MSSNSASGLQAHELTLKFPPNWPYRSSDFARRDTSPDNDFYAEPRFVHHIDAGARGALTAYLEQTFADQLARKRKLLAAASSNADEKAGHESCKLDALDVCSSWVSHWPASLSKHMGRTAGVGMNKDELARNKALQEVAVVDLNDNSFGEPKLPLKDDSFDVATLTVSVDYLIHPLAVFKELFRVLRPGQPLLPSNCN